jgi:hypothetical protein
MRGRAVSLELAVDLEPVHLGHHHVEQDEVGQLRRANGECRGAAAGGQDIEIFTGKLGAQQLDVDVNVVDDEDACRHRRRLSSGSVQPLRGS